MRYIGGSNFSGWHLMKSLAAADRHGFPRHVAHQVYYSLLNRDYEWELMPLGIDQGVGAVVWSPSGWGKLTGKIRRGQPAAAGTRAAQIPGTGPHYDEERLFRIVDAVDKVVKETGKAFTQVALNWLLQKPTDLDAHHRRPRRAAARHQYRRGRLVADAGAGEGAGCRERGAGRLSGLAPARVPDAEREAGLVDAQRAAELLRRPDRVVLHQAFPGFERRQSAEGMHGAGLREGQFLVGISLDEGRETRGIGKHRGAHVDEQSLPSGRVNIQLMQYGQKWCRFGPCKPPDHRLARGHLEALARDRDRERKRG